MNRQTVNINLMIMVAESTKLVNGFINLTQAPSTNITSDHIKQFPFYLQVFLNYIRTST